MIQGLQNLPLLSLVTFIPLIGAIVIAFIPSDRLRAIRWAAFITAMLAWVASLAILAGFDINAAGFQFKEQADWVPAFGIQYKLGVDGISLALVVLTTTLTWISILASFKPIQTRVKEYMISFLILEVGMIGVVPGARHVPVLHLLRDRADPDVPDHRHLGWRQPRLRDDQVRHLHARRIAAHARRDPGYGVLVPGRHGLMEPCLRLRGAARLRL